MAQKEMKKKKHVMKCQQLQKQVAQAIDRLVINEIDTICNKVIFTHLDPLTKDNMYYIVKHADKQAVFKLNDKKDGFGDIKGNIALYFGLPDQLIFLENSKNEIMLDKHKVIDEIFPLQSSKIKGEDPTLYVTFKQNWTTLDYILGDQKEKAIKEKQQEDYKKEQMAEEIKNKKKKALDLKNEEMQKTTDKALYDYKF